MTVGSITVLSRILGLLRDVVIARMLGAGVGADAFFVAFRIPNFLRRLFAEGAFSQAFVPVLSEYRVAHDHRAVRDLVAHVAGALGSVLMFVSGLGMLLAPLVIHVFAPGFSAGDGMKHQIAADMLRITFPYLFCISLAALAASILNCFERFAVPALTPLLLNVSMIGSALMFADQFDVPAMALAWGVAVGGVAQLCVLLPSVARLGLLVWPRIKRSHQGVRRIVQLMLPAMFGASVAQVNLLVNTLLASFLVTGSVTWLYFADRLLEFPLGVFGVALGTVILPRLSGQHARQDNEAFAVTLDWALRLGALIAIPAALALYLLAVPLLTTLLQYGAFTAHDATMAAAALRAYAPGLCALVAIKILAPGYFARQDTRTPVRFGVVAVGANMLLSIALFMPLGHVGLAIGITGATCVNALLLYRGLLRRGVYSPRPGWIRTLAIALAAACAMGVVLVSFSGPPGDWFAYSLWQRVGHLSVLVIGGAAAYAAVLLALGLRPHELRPPGDSSARA